MVAKRVQLCVLSINIWPVGSHDLRPLPGEEGRDNVRVDVEPFRVLSLFHHDDVVLLLFQLLNSEDKRKRAKASRTFLYPAYEHTIV